MEYTIHLGEDTLNELDKIVNGGVEVEPLEVTENGEYTAPEGKAYSPVSVNVEGGGGGSSDLKTVKINVVATNNGRLVYTTITDGILNNAQLNGSGEIDALVEYDGEVYYVIISGKGIAFDSVTFTNAVNCEGDFSKPDDANSFGVFVTDINAEASITAEVTFESGT